MEPLFRSITKARGEISKYGDAKLTDLLAQIKGVEATIKMNKVAPKVLIRGVAEKAETLLPGLYKEVNKTRASNICFFNDITC